MNVLRLSLCVCGTIAAAAAAAENKGKKRLSFLSKLDDTVADHDGVGSILPLKQSFSTRERALAMLSEDVGDKECDAAFLHCSVDEDCVDCFIDMQIEDIDWASVTEDTQCKDIIRYINDVGLCAKLNSNVDARDLFCDTIQTCVLVDEENYDENDIDCSALTECNWPGIHKSFLGDGVCNDNMRGCYNTKICNYDGGDCCPDTCVSNSTYLECGHDGYACRNTNSTNCNPDLNKACPERRKNEPEDITCEYNQAKYRLVMYDSFGDGWDDTRIKITDASGIIVYEGGLDEGYQGTEFICLKTITQCYRVQTWGGTWGNEVSWEVKPLTEGPAVGSGGAPMSCEFNPVGSNCMPLCFGRPNKHPEKDPDYREYKEMYKCIEKKCPVQMGACKDDPDCKPCLQEDPELQCFGMDTFATMTDCALCKCSDITDEEFCNAKFSPGLLPPSNALDPSSSENIKKPCTPTETIAGGLAVLHFSECTPFSEIGMMITEFDQNNFGELDKFEACAHAYDDDREGSGRTALGCLNILYTAMNNVDAENGNEYIAKLAKTLYYESESFCDCAKETSDACPLCPSFSNFKTLLYESLDACQALDEIDCDAWDEFQKPCRTNLQTTYGKVDLTNPEQCEYVKGTCGHVGPFPAFRRLDCASELSSTSWEFYNSFSDNCLIKTTLPPSPAPTEYKSPQSEDKNPYVPPEEKDKKPYIAPDDNKSKGSSASSGSKGSSKSGSSHWFRNLFFFCVFGGAGYVYYTRYRDGYAPGPRELLQSFMPSMFNRRRNAYMAGNTVDYDDGIYSGLSLETTPSTFTPPPAPSAYNPTA